PEMKTQPPPPPALGRGTVRDLFDKVFWPAYPRKEHKKQAWIVFELLGPGADLLREIMAFLESEKTDWENGRTCPLPDNFLKAREWKHVRPLPPKVKPGGIIVSDAIVPEPNEALTSNGAFLNKGRTYPRD
ncbi:MAG: hypothetical protein L0H94_05225, partial [Nitrospira sp.]|nr:hypothetical protein [Nitrospira sp.]